MFSGDFVYLYGDIINSIMQTLKNDVLTVEVSEHGAELQSIRKGTTEYLWQGDPAYWGRRSPVLFPIVGSVWEKRYRVNGTEYELGQHGFARDMKFVLVSQTEDEVRYRLESDEETLKKYPYPFVLEIAYRLHGSSVDVIWEVTNPASEEMYFQIGCGAIVLDDLENKLKKYYGINRESYFVISKPEENQKFVLATCCTPILGENVVGFKNSDGTITVHTRTCSNANNLAAKFGDKIVTVKWDMDLNSGSQYLARISLKGTDRIGMMNDITRVTSQVMNINIRRINLGAEDGIFDGFIDLYVHHIDDLDNLMKKLREIEGLESVAKAEL